MADTFISGKVTESGNPVEDAIVAAVRQQDVSDLSQSQATEVAALMKRTDANGEYKFEKVELFTNTNNYHVVAHKDAGDKRRGVENYAYVEATGEAIPDSAVARFYAPQSGFTGGQTVNSWPDTINSTNLNGVNSPILNSSSLNNVDAVDTSQNNGYFDWNNSPVSAPATIIWGFELLSTSSNDHLLRIQSGDAVQINNNNYQLSRSNRSSAGGSVSTGDHIVTLTIDSSQQAFLRVNGTQVATVSFNPDILENGSEIFNDARNSGRVVQILAGEMVVYDEELTGSDLTAEEERIETNLNMSVL